MEMVVEALAEVLYHHNRGMTDEDWLNTTGERRGEWGSMREHERDDYRFMAHAALSALAVLTRDVPESIR